MNTILNILPWLIAIACAALYVVDRIKLKSLKIDYQELNAKYSSEQASSLGDKQLMHSLNQDILKYRNELTDLSFQNTELRSAINLLEDQNKSNPLNGLNDILSPVSINPKIEYKGQISTNSLEINSSLLIGDNKLFDVFKRLLNSNLLPESIKDKLDFQEKELSIIIWTQEFDEDGHPIKCLSWKQIIDQIKDKKQLITEYLQGVIQESNRAMVVHQALSEKPAKDVHHA